MRASISFCTIGATSKEWRGVLARVRETPPKTNFLSCFLALVIGLSCSLAMYPLHNDGENVRLVGFHIPGRPACWELPFLSLPFGSPLITYTTRDCPSCFSNFPAAAYHTYPWVTQPRRHALRNLFSACQPHFT